MQYLIFLLIALLPWTSPANTALQCFKNCIANNKLYILLRNEEGFSPFIYKDSAGISTICNGHVVGKHEHFDQPLTGKQCEKILKKDVSATEEKVNHLVEVPLYINQHNSLVSFTYNLGAGTLAKSSVLEKVNANQHREVPSRIMVYNHVKNPSTGLEQVSRGLTIRRRIEASLYQDIP